jgi:hypothetical protein
MLIKIGVEQFRRLPSCGRTLIAGPSLCEFCACAMKLPSNGHMAKVHVQACSTACSFTMIIGQQSVDAGLATILNSTSPIFISVDSVSHATRARNAAQMFGVM